MEDTNLRDEIRKRVRALGYRKFPDVPMSMSIHMMRRLEPMHETEAYVKCFDFLYENNDDQYGMRLGGIGEYGKFVVFMLHLDLRYDILEYKILNTRMDTLDEYESVREVRCCWYELKRLIRTRNNLLKWWRKKLYNNWHQIGNIVRLKKKHERNKGSRLWKFNHFVGQFNLFIMKEFE